MAFMIVTAIILSVNFGVSSIAAGLFIVDHLARCAQRHQPVQQVKPEWCAEADGDRRYQEAEQLVPCEPIPDVCGLQAIFMRSYFMIEEQAADHRIGIACKTAVCQSCQ